MAAGSCTTAAGHAHDPTARREDLFRINRRQPVTGSHSDQAVAIDAQALIITSCTYDGLRYDLPPIVEAAHARGIKVIIDEAWDLLSGGATTVFDRDTGGMDHDWQDIRQAPEGTPQLTVDADIGFGEVRIEPTVHVMYAGNGACANG